MKFGYARVSTKDQNLDLQIDALEKVSCEKIYKEKVSAVKERPVLEKMNAQLRKGDVVVVWKLDRLGRSLKHLVELGNYYREIGVELISIQDNIDTTTAQGRLMFNLFATFAEFERELISERTKAGLVRARANGRTGGRPKGLSKESKQKAWAIMGMLDQVDETGGPKHSAADIQKILGIPKTTYYRLIEWAESQKSPLNNKQKR